MSRRISAPILAAFAALALVVTIVGPASAATPTKQQWLQDVATVMNSSTTKLQSRIDKGGSKLAINLDIDNSSLETFYSPGVAIPQVLAFANYARAHGVAVLFNTARTASSSTTTQLKAAGYTVNGVCARNSGEGTAAGKQRCRALFISQGYTLIANVGNNDTDFSGTQNFGLKFQLPNYNGQLS